ncbi:MAG: hypothetical protein ACRDUW_10905 [Pseudonocardiaceae bacterium]
MADTWVIVPQGQRQTTELATNGTGFIQTWEITFRITAGPASGTTGVFRIPADLYNTVNVQSGIQAQVDQLNEIAGL